MNWHCKSFRELSAAELYSILQLRSAVFVVEQQCVYQDLDGKDEAALHLWASDEEGHIVACCRILPAGVSYPEASVGRVAAAVSQRKRGTGRLLMEKAMAYIQQEWQSPVRISAQEYLRHFYESLGFVPTGYSYLEDGIPHIEMLHAGTR